MNDLVERLQNLIEVSEVACERDLYKECSARIEVLEAFHAGNSDMQLMLYNRIEALETALRAIVDEGCDCYACNVARAALKEGNG